MTTEAHGARPHRGARYPQTPWSAARLYRPFVRAALAAGASGFLLGAWLLASTLGGRPSPATAALVEVHGSIQLLGWCGLFVMGVASHVVPRFQGNARIPFPAPQRVALALCTGGLAARAVAQPWGSGLLGGTIVGVAGFSVAAGLGILAWTMTVVLRGGQSDKRPVTHWLWLGLVGAVVTGGLYAVLSADLAWTGGLADPHWNAAFQRAAVYGFIMPFTFGVSSRAIAGFIGLAPRRRHADRTAWLLLAGGGTLSAFSAAVDGGMVLQSTADALLAGALVMFTVSLRVFEPRKQPAGVRDVWTVRYVRVAYGWLLVGAALHGIAALEAWSLPISISVSGRPELHVLGIGYFTILIVGFGQKALPLFERRPLPYPAALGPALVMLFLAAALRLVGAILADDAILRLASVAGLFGFSLGGLPIAMLVWSPER